MPRSSRHKSGKHSSREARDYSESEKDSSYKEKKGREDSSVSIRPPKESLSTSGEKRKAIDSKSSADNCRDLTGSENVECVEDVAPSSSKKRKEKVDDDRWIGGDNGEREVLRNEMNVKDSKGAGVAKSRLSRRDENSGLGIDGEGGKRSGSKIESEHHRPDRKEKSEKEEGLERERKVKDGGRSDKLGDGVDDKSKKDVGSSEERGTKHAIVNTEPNLQDGLRTPHLEKDNERRVRSKKDVSGDVDVHQDCGREQLDDGRLYSKVDIDKPVRPKDGVQKDERGRDKYKEVLDKDGKHHEEKTRDRDGRNTRDYSHSRSNDKHMRTNKKDTYLQQKKSRSRDGDHDYGNDRGRYSRDDRDHDTERDRDKDHDRDCDHERDHSYERSRDIDRERDRNYRDRARERVRDRDRDFVHDSGRDWDQDHDRDYNSHAEDRGSRYKEDRLRRRSDDYDDYLNDKSRSVKVEAKAERNRSVSRRPHMDTITSSRGRSSPRSHGVDKYRDHDDFRHGDSMKEMAGNSETHDKVSKYRIADKRAKYDDNRLGDLSAERSPNTKSSAMGLMERSPSCTSMERKHVNLGRSGRRRSLDVDEADRRSSGSNDLKDGSANEERQSRDLASKKPFVEEHHQAESSFHQRSRQGPGGSGFRGGLDGPFMGAMGEDSRVHSGRYRRSVDPNVGRSHPWKGVPNWPSPLPNGYMPFPPGPHGPPHGSFPPIIPQFHSPPLFGARPLEMNHSGIPFMSDADRFSGHIRPHGWQNMVEGSGPSHFPVWDASNGAFRDKSSMYGAGYQANGQLRDTNADMWKNGDASLDEGPAPHKDGPSMKIPMEEAYGTQGPQGSRNESTYDEVENKTSKTKTPSSCLNRETPVDKTPESSSADDPAKALRVYLSKLDISFELAEPELYNQCMSLVVEGQNGIVSDDVTEHVRLEDPIMTSEVANSTLGFFPAAEESIFQRALDLYKTHCTGRRLLSVANVGEEMLSTLAPEEHHLDTVSDLKDGIDGLVHIGGQETQKKSIPLTDVDPELLPDAEPEAKVPCSWATEEGQKDKPSESLELIVKFPLIENTDGGIANPIEEIGDAVSELLSQKDVSDGGELSFKVTPEEVSGSKATDAEINVVAGSKATDAEINVVTGSKAIDAEINVVIGSGGSASSSVKQPDDADAVNDPLVLAEGSVKVCETSLSVSHESESVILSRIHHAPESTH